jgi:HEPN domain-containing protein
MALPEGSRWIRAAADDLDAARSLLEGGYYHLCAFHAQQAAEKALKGLLRLLGRVPWGHNCFDLLTQVDSLLSGFETPPVLFDAAQRLDSHYIPSRYPDAFPVGVPADHYDEQTASQAIVDADIIFKFVQRNAL